MKVSPFLILNIAERLFPGLLKVPILNNVIYLKKRLRGELMYQFLPINKNKLEEVLNNGKGDFQTHGYIDAGLVEGDDEAFVVSIERFYDQIILKLQSLKNQKLQEDEDLKNKLNSFDEKIKVYENEIQRIKNENIPEIEKELRTAENTLTEFQHNPDKFVKQQKDKFKLWYLGIITVVVGLFLYFFYSSVVYSAFFRDITINKYTLFNSIFYERAFEEAIQKGFTTFMVTALAPFVFLALGIVIDNYKHIQNKNAKYVRYSFIAIAFLVDALLAYHISERIYNSEALNSFGEVKLYSVLDALADPNFWMIIFFGFMVYILFGIIFSFYNEERKNTTAHKAFEQGLRAKISDYQNQLIKAKEKVEDLKIKINEIEHQKTDLINSSHKVFFSNHEIKYILNEYALGWITYLKRLNNSDSKISKIKNLLNIFYQKKGLNHDEA